MRSKLRLTLAAALTLAATTATLADDRGPLSRYVSELHAAADAVSQDKQVVEPAQAPAAKLTPFANDGVDKPSARRAVNVVQSDPAAPRPFPNDGIDTP